MAAHAVAEVCTGRASSGAAASLGVSGYCRCSATGATAASNHCTAPSSVGERGSPWAGAAGRRDSGLAAAHA